jgi:RNA polymerase sigma factor (sigma-70 family)
MTKLLRFYTSDEQIIKSICDGDDSVLVYLYQKNLRMIMKYIGQNNGNEVDAREILQEALVTFWEKVRKGDFILQSKISTFLYGVVRKKWLQELNRRKRYTTLEQISNNPGEDTDIADTIEATELIEIIKHCLRKLSPICQKILTAFYFEEKSMHDISVMLGLANEDVAKSKKYQCKKELEHLVKQDID